VYRCTKCGEPWDDSRAQDNDLSCTKRCGGRLELVPPLGLADLRGLDLQRLPYPVALTARRLEEALDASTDVLKTLFLLKDGLEASLKYLGALLLVEYLRNPACTTQRNDALLEKLIRPALGMWVNDVIRPLSLWLVTGDQEQEPGRLVAALFAEPPRKARANPSETELFRACARFVGFRNDTLGHGARQRDAEYEADLREWLPVTRRLLGGIASLAPWRLTLVADVDRGQVWMGPEPGTATEPGAFARAQVGHFVVRGPEGDVRDLFPFVSYLPASDRDKAQRLHYYDALHRYKAAGKDAQVLDYDEGFKQARPEPVAGLEAAFTAELLADKFGRHRGRMEVIEGRVASFGALIDEHAAIVGRRFVIDHVARFLRDNDRGLLVIEAEPGKGKTALMAHLVDTIYGHVAPPPAHFFYRRTAGITDPDVCVKSLYHSLLEAHNLTEAEESRQQSDPESMYLKLTNLLTDQVAPRLTPGRPQLIFIDALDESEPTANGRTAFQRIPENLPAGVYIIATTRPVTDRVRLARRPFLHGFDLDAPDHLQANLADGLEYARRELAHSPLGDAAITEVARVAAGNFLVLTLLCRHIRTDLAPGEVPGFLHRLATDGARDQLRFIYEEFWHRITARLTRADLQVLCVVAGVLVAAYGPLTADVIAGVLGLRAGDWDFALRHLHEYLTVLRSEEGEAVETFYRIYHESFAEFLRAKTAVDRSRHRKCLADYCLAWSRHEGYGKLYALRFGPRHLVEDERWDDIETLLLDPVQGLYFLEAKAEAGLVFDLAMDFTRVLQALPARRRSRRHLQLIERALRRNIHFIASHPSTLFQCLWNQGWWYDCPGVEEHYEILPNQRGRLAVPRSRRLSTLLESWRDARRTHGDGPLLLSLRPPSVPLGTAEPVVLRGTAGAVLDLDYSPDGKQIASVGGGHIWLWDTATYQTQAVLEPDGWRPRCVAYTADGRSIAVGGRDGKVHLVDLATSEETREIEVGRGTVNCVAFSRDGSRLLATTVARGYGVWDVATWEPVRLFPWGPAGFTLNCMGLSPDGRLVAVNWQFYAIHVFDVDSGREVLRRQGSAVACPVAFSPDSRTFVCDTSTSGRGFNLAIHDATTGTVLAKLKGHTSIIRDALFSPDGLVIATASDDDTVRVWDAVSGSEVQTLRGHTNRVGCVTFSPDGRFLASGSSDQSIHVTDLKTAREPDRRRIGDDRDATAVSLSPDGRCTLTTFLESGIGFWDTRTGKKTDFRLEGDSSGSTSAAFSPDGRRIAAASFARVGVWDARTGRQLLVIKPDRAGPQGTDEEPYRVSDVQYFPDGLTILGCVQGLSLTAAVIWSAIDGRELFRISLKTDRLWAVTCSRDGRMIAGAFPSGCVRVWDASTGRLLRKLETLRRTSAVAFSPSGTAVVAGGEFREGVQLWNLRTGDMIWETDFAIEVGSLVGGERFWLLDAGSEAVVFDLDQDEEIAWYPEPLSHVAVHPTGTLWAGLSGHRLQIIELVFDRAGPESGKPPAAEPPGRGATTRQREHTV
jgi:WD40 repeat protein